jgi:sugar phosphate isomerase/epimerase
MELILSTGSVHTLPLERQFAIAREAGFAGLEYVITREHDGRKEAELLAHTQSSGLPVRNLHAPFQRMDGWGNQADCVLRTVELARRLNSRSITFHPPQRALEEVEFVRWMSRIDDFQAQVGGGDVLVTVENMPRARSWRGIRLPFATDPFRYQRRDELWDLLEERNLYLTFDTTHFGTAGENLPACFAQFRERVRTVHLSNFRSRDFQEHLPPHEGDLDLTNFVRRLTRAGYQDLVTLEVFPRFLENRMGGIRQGLADFMEWMAWAREPVPSPAGD